MVRRISRFAIIGVLNTGLDILILNGLFWLWPPHGQALMVIWENMLACVVASIQSFFFNKFWTFKDTSPITFQQVLKFAGVTGGNMILNTLILEALIKILGVSPDGAGPAAVALKAGVAAIMMVVSFCGMLLLVFVRFKDKVGDRGVPSNSTFIPYHPYQYSLSVVLPAYNEEQNIAHTIYECLTVLPKLVTDYEVIVVNDGSSDETGSIVTSIAYHNSHVRLVQHEVNRGAGAALVSGFEAACKELTMYMDSDGQFSIKELVHMLPHIDDVDGIFGYRIARQDRFIRKANAWGWRWLIYVVFGVKVRDIDCGFKVFRTRFLQSQKFDARGAMLLAEIVYRFMRADLTYKEVGVHHYNRKFGSATGAKLSVILRAFGELWVCANKWAREEQKIAS